MQRVSAKHAAFRADIRQNHFPAIYNGWVHLGWTSGISLAVILWSAIQVAGVSPAAWLTVPLTFLFANLVEHRLHSGPMHHRVDALGTLYDRHTLSHHHYFHHDTMIATGQREFYMVLFPPWAVLALSVLIFPPAGALALLFGANIAWLFIATSVSYFLLYEWLHLAYHLDPAGPVGRLPGMAVLRAHHTAHHDLRLMGRWNFNVTFPIADAVFGTLRRSP